MKICGIICEFNPFHAGHAYLLDCARRRTSADMVVCLMSGEFTQRGEPAVCDKWTRAKMALLSGADVVIELPFLFAVASAERFAQGAIRILDALGCDCLSFGAEHPDTTALSAAAHILRAESASFRIALRESLDNGASYAAAKRSALRCAAPHLYDAVDGANDLLATEYIRAANAIGSDIEMIAIRRRGSGHDSEWTPGLSPNASAIREALFSSDASGRADICSCAGVPITINPVKWKRSLFTLAASLLRSTPPQMLSELVDMEHGLEWRLINAAKTSTSWDEMIRSAASRRHPPSRIRRVLLYALLGITRRTYASIEDCDRLYAHVLGIRDGAKKALGYLCRRSQIPVSSSPRRLTNSLLLSTDIVASDTYGLLMEPVRRAGADFTTPLQTVPCASSSNSRI